MYLFAASILLADPTSDYFLYRAVAKSREVSPSVVFPPSGGERLPEKSFLVTYSTGEKLHTLKLEMDFLEKLHTRAQNTNSSNEPFYARGKNYIIESPKKQFYLIYYEDDDRIDKELLGFRFRISLLLKIGENENLFVKSAQEGGSSFDETMLKIFRKVTAE